MGTENTLVALAYVKETENPMEVFCNYVVICLLKSPDRKLRHDELCDSIEELFGIKMPQHMIKMFCRILEKQKRIIKLPQGAGYECKDEEFDLDAYEEKRKELMQKEWVLTNGLRNLAEDYNLSWTFEEAKQHLTDFLIIRENAVKIFSKNQIDAVEKNNYVPNEWYVAKYISYILERNDGRCEYLLDIINGLMVYLGVYETNDYYQDCTQKFKGTNFYLDTKLVLRILGYSWNLEIEAAKELADLIQNDYGGNVCVFEHTIGEIESALYNASEYLDKNEIILDNELRIYAELNKCTAYDMKLHSDSVRGNIKKLGFKITDEINWNDKDVQKWNLDEELLKRYIMEKHPKWKERAIDNDICAINNINIMRKGNYSVKYGGRKKLPVFITTNTALVWRMREYINLYSAQDQSVASWKSNALPIITDNMLMCRLWLPRAKANLTIPAMTLARNAYAAQQVSSDFFEKIKNTAKELKAKHNVDVINVSTIRKEKFEELLIKNSAGDIDGMTVDVMATSMDEVIQLETISLNETIEELKNQNNNQIVEIQKGRENAIKSAVQRFKGKLGIGKLYIYLAKYYWLIVAIIFALFAVLLGNIKGTSFMGVISFTGPFYIFLTIINKVLEKAFSRSSWGELILSKVVKHIWKKYAHKIKNELLEFEKELEPEILRACLEEDSTLSQYQQYCIE
ncbi:MAG: hypothetical protein IJA07_00715 [Agathobacter sp.]|nr:hypothetical protein [Agathobacter sp.]